MGVITPTRSAELGPNLSNPSLIKRSLLVGSHDRPAFPHSQDETTEEAVPLRPPNQAGEITAIPNPTPDTGFLPTHEKGSRHPHSNTRYSPLMQLSTSMGHSLRPSPRPFSETTFSVPSPTTTSSTQAIEANLATNTATTVSFPTPSLDPRVIRGRPTLSLVATVLIAIGGSCLLVGIFLAFRWLSPPRRRHFPRPSLPKLENVVIDEEKLSSAVKESPIFGPNERFSQPSGANTAWSWVTYPQLNSAGMDTDKKKINDAMNIGTINPPTLLPAVYPPSTSVYPFNSHCHIRNTPVGSADSLLPEPEQSLLKQAHTGLEGPRSTARSSIASLAYKGMSCTVPKDDETSYTENEDEKRRSKSFRKSRSHSIYEDSRLSIGLAYDGADVVSPVQPTTFTPLGSPCSYGGSNLVKMESRTRIQSPYYPTASYPRIFSGLATTYGVATRVKLGDGGSIRGVDSLNPKSDSQRAKETRALTQALGFSSSPTGDFTLSPESTLYPDDSFSAVDPRRLLKPGSQKKRVSTSLGNDRFNQVSDERRHQLVASTGRSVVAVASGSLVSTEDLRALSTGNNGSGANLKTSLTGPTLINSPSSGRKSTPVTSRNTTGSDRPPRVPSPPRLPSLAQMALEHSNPGAYTNYRSPTYSIYNLYEDEQKRTGWNGKRWVGGGSRGQEVKEESRRY